MESSYSSVNPEYKNQIIFLDEMRAEPVPATSPAPLRTCAFAATNIAPPLICRSLQFRRRLRVFNEFKKKSAPRESPGRDI